MGEGGVNGGGVSMKVGLRWMSRVECEGVDWNVKHYLNPFKHI